MTLAEAIGAAQDRNEQRLAAEINAPKHKLDDTEMLLILRSFVGWCKTRGVRALPAAPSTCAAWIRFQDAHHIAPATIEKAIEAIQIAHDEAGAANPIATAAVRAELARILKVEPPRWNKREQLVFYGLPPEVRAIITRHSLLDSKAVRKAQNEVAELRLQLNQKGNTENESSNP